MNLLHNRPLRLALMASAFSALVACGNTWVQITPEGQAVSLANAADVRNCTRVGTANVNALDNIAFINRGAKPLQAELVGLARNEGGRLGGNRVVPESTIQDGRQTFGVYRC